jgi:hypothetical protein
MPGWIATPVPEIDDAGKPAIKSRKVLSNEAIRRFHAAQANVNAEKVAWI